MTRPRSVFGVLILVQGSVMMIPAALFIFVGVAVSIHEGRSRDRRPSTADQTMVEP